MPRKNGVREDTINEISDLLYHLVVMMADQNIRLEEIEAVLKERSSKIGNLKTPHQSNPNS